MAQVKMAVAPALKAQRAKSLKSEILPKQTKLIITDLIDNDTDDERPNRDGSTKNVLSCINAETGKRVNVPVREFMNFLPKNATDQIYSRSDDGEDIIFPKSFTIVESTDRMDRQQRKVYPTFVYNKVQDFLDTIELDNNDPKKFSYEQLLEGGKKKEFEEIDPVQDYTVSVELH